MGVYLDSWLLELALALSALLLAAYLSFQWRYQYWSKKGVPCVEPSFPFGNLGHSLLGQKFFGDVLRELYEKAKGKRFIGLYSILRPVLLVRDPEIVRHILIKGFASFRERGIFMDDEQPLNSYLFWLPAQEWHHRRAKLTPAFSSGKLKGLFQDLAAECLGLFAVGFETSASTISYSLYELALLEDIQSNLQLEIDSVLQRHDDNITYDGIDVLSRQSGVCRDRCHQPLTQCPLLGFWQRRSGSTPPLSLLNRDCVEPYKMPDSDVVVDRATAILASLFGLHYDAEHFPDPERYGPERFSEEQKAKRNPYVYLPFGDGPHICIVKRLGLLQTKVGLVNILSMCSVRPAEKTTRHVTYNSRGVMLVPTKEIELKFDKR
ncbi:cytochrome P450 6k1-like [Schistocerca cancellata]|uniref:cytochrome P450 6k1-like n=1 Tax=Schistocerca cancellata TaxID=274614 RepID=UPI00211821E5|nr:cytochrome P450 6k1-like [Schistocerca cancellata]